MDNELYPIWVCGPCGNKHGRLPLSKWPEYKTATWHVGQCDICGSHRAVTEPRDFGHLKNTWYPAFLKGQGAHNASIS